MGRHVIASFKGMSIVVPAYNEEKALPLTLASINHALLELQTHVNIKSEIIVVDNVSTDSTAEVAKSFGARVIRHETRNIASVRNAGIQAAANELVLTIDADTLVPKHAFIKIWQSMKTGRYVGGGVRVGVSGPRKTFKILVTTLDAAMFMVTRLSGGLFFFDKQAAIAIGGFPEGFMAAEDIAFARQLKRFGAKTGLKFLNLHTVRILTMDRKKASISQSLRAFGSGIKAYLGFKLSNQELSYWYDPDR